MEIMQTIKQLISGSEITEYLADFLEQNFEDFPEVRQKYREAMECFRQELSPTAGVSVAGEEQAVRQQIASTLRYACFLGLKANLDHFTDPVSRNFLDTDPEVYLRESTSKRLPEYESAQAVRKRFFASLSPSQRTRYQDVTEYICYLETVGPKLAHYMGFMIGNALFPRTVPGYHADGYIMLRYEKALKQQLCKKNLKFMSPFGSLNT